MDHGQPADLPALDQARRFAPLLAGEVDVATGQRGDRRGAAGEHDAVRLRNRNAGGVQELGHGERRDPGDAGDAVAEGLGIGLGGRRHVLQALPRRVFLDRVHDGIEREQRDRRLAVHLERHVAFDREQHRRARVWVEQQRVAVRPRADRAQRAGDARGARHVDDVHRLPPLLRRIGGNQPSGHVGSAAGRVSHDVSTGRVGYAGCASTGAVSAEPTITIRLSSNVRAIRHIAVTSGAGTAASTRSARSRGR